MIRLGRRALDAFALRFSEAERRLADLSLVRSPPLPLEGTLVHRTDTGEEVHANHSRFNPVWPTEFGFEPTTIFDVGSFDAGDAIRLRLAFPKAQAYSFEPDPTRYPIVEQNAKRFGIVAANLAVTDKDGRIDWFASSGGSSGSTLPHSDAFRKRHPYFKLTKLPEAVGATRLDSFCKANDVKSIDVLHIDAEGAEHQVLSGLGDLRPRLIFHEITPRELWKGAHSGRELHVLLSRMGFVLAGDFRADRLYLRHDLVR